jgi:hypothetical protein
MVSPLDSPFPKRNSDDAGNNKSALRPGLHDNIASADLQNPSDALEILAQVADRADDADSGGEQSQARHAFTGNVPRPLSVQQTQSSIDAYFHYKPVQDGIISPDLVYRLFSTYGGILNFVIIVS